MGQTMSLKDFKGSVYLFQRLMAQAQAEIDKGEKQGAEKKYPAPDATVYRVERNA